jgi:malonyl-CoA/methylmalonyl-CoA synthetase
MSSFYAELDAVFARCSDKVCLYVGGAATTDTWTYAQLRERVARIARVLENAGVHRADRVVVQVTKSPDNLALYLATLSCGAVYVPLNTAYTQAELDYFIADAAPALFVGEAVRDDVTTLTHDAQGRGTLIDAIEDSPIDAAPNIAVCQTDDLATILYTSGTTGRSKGAMLTHGNLASNAHALSEAWGWRDDDVLLHALLIFHVHGLFVASHCALLNGTPMVFLPKFDSREVLENLASCTVMMGVPTFYTRLLGEPDLTPAAVEHIRAFICGSAPLTEQTFAEWERRTGHQIVERYGMSETIINTTNPLEGERVPGSVGFALPDLAIRIANDDGVEVARGEVGTIEVSGPAVFKGYWQMPEKTREEIRDDGFFITGDLGIQDAQGRVSIVGRSKDLVISGGYNVYPKEVERLLDEIPGVLESAVIGVPHPDFGEGVVAVVVPDGEDVGLETVNVALSDQLARFKQPKALVNVSELPRNTMGKVQKNILRDEYKELFT